MKPSEFNNGTLKILYKSYKKFLIPAGIVLSCIVIFFYFLIPQVQDIFTLKDERAALLVRIGQLQKNTQTLQSIDESAVSGQLEVATSALPPDKNFEGILNAIGSAAQGANVVLGDYSFDVGDLATKSAKPAQLSLEMQVSINGQPQDMQRFLTELGTRVPISDPQLIDISDAQSIAKVDFFYRPFPDLTFDPQAPIRQVTTKDAQTITTLQQWRDASTASPFVQSVVVPTGQAPTPTGTVYPNVPSPVVSLPAASPSAASK